jgi:hypothetical protein
MVEDLALGYGAAPAKDNAGQCGPWRPGQPPQGLIGSRGPGAMHPVPGCDADHDSG